MVQNDSVMPYSTGGGIISAGYQNTTEIIGPSCRACSAPQASKMSTVQSEVYTVYFSVKILFYFKTHEVEKRGWTFQAYR